jgi:NAD+ synthetase
LKIYNNFKIEKLPETLQFFLEKYRKERNFNPNYIIEEKSKRINEYFYKCGLKTAIVAISGGVDSALVVALLNYASKLKDSPIKNIVPVFLPAYDSDGVTGQQEAGIRAKEVCDRYKLIMKEIDISNDTKTLGLNVEKELNINSNNWCKGQLVPYLRTTALYYCATLYNQENNKSVIVGTTNADEGQYIGYFGKASDGLVDIQLISDLHKSEVYTLSKLLNVPDSIINVSPTGDMYDSRLDEEVFGAPYGFIELYRFYLSLNDKEKDIFEDSLKLNNELSIFLKLKDNLENMHKYNGHKYLGCSPAIHFDVIDIKIKNGWKYSIYE